MSLGGYGKVPQVPENALRGACADPRHPWDMANYSGYVERAEGNALEAFCQLILV